jgi:ketosteroid isomerase-like protein
VTDVVATVSKIQGTYAAAVLARDVGAFMRLYDPKVRVFDAWGVWQYEGASAWESAVDGWFKSLGTERVRVTFQETQTFGTAEGACTSGIVTYAAESAQGEALRVMQNRMTWGLRTAGHVLRIVHEHTSAPVGFDDLKAITQRPPAR